jgi:hypothetical protein
MLDDLSDISGTGINDVYESSSQIKISIGLAFLFSLCSIGLLSMFPK